MTNYNINRNRKPLTDADISKGQDFDAFLKSYSGAKPPFYKTGTFYMSVVALGLVIGVGAYFMTNEEDAAAKTAYVQPAFNGIDVADTVYKMNAAEGGEFIYTTGSLIRVPEGGFLDSAGNVVKGDVEIRYREFHNTADIFLAGIPMTYDSAGINYHFESAGMLEITAWQNGKPLKANPNAPVKIAMASNSSEEKFNVYYLDTVKKNWDFIAKDKAVVVGFAKDTTKADSLAKGKSTASLSPPLEVKKADKKKPSFVIGFEPAEFPELASYKGVRFQVDDEKTPYDKKDKEITWEDVSIMRNTDGATYTVTFTHGVITRTYITDVVVNAEDYAAAKKVYDAKYVAYQAALKAINDKNAADDKSLEAKLLNADGRRIFDNDQAMRSALERRSAIDRNNEKEDMVVREFIINDFGIWNSDCPSSLPVGETLFVKLFDSRTKKPLVVNHVILVEKGKNAVYTYYASDLRNFQFNPDAENLLWAVTQDGKLAICSDSDLQAMVGKTEANLTMTVSAEDLKTAEQARVALGIGI